MRTKKILLFLILLILFSNTILAVNPSLPVIAGSAALITSQTTANSHHIRSDIQQTSIPYEFAEKNHCVLRECGLNCYRCSINEDVGEYYVSTGEYYLLTDREGNVISFEFHKFSDVSFTLAMIIIMAIAFLIFLIIIGGDLIGR